MENSTESKIESGDLKKRYDALVLQISNGSRSALETLYEEMKTPVYGLALAILKSSSSAEDVMQNVFIKVWENASQYRRGTDARAWIMQITRNTALHCFRNRRHLCGLDEMENVLTAQDDLSPALDKMLLSALLCTLDGRERQIIMLYATCGYSHKEIAKILGIPYATVRWKFSNAMKKLSKLVKEEEV